MKRRTDFDDPFFVNAADAAAAVCQRELIDALNTLGQDAERGYRRALHPIWVKCPGASWFDRRWAIESAVEVLSMVTYAVVTCGAGKSRNLAEAQFADLVSFFIDRMANNIDVLRPNNLSRAVKAEQLSVINTL